MPNNVLFMDTMFPHVESDDTWQNAVKQILNYDFMLKEELQYMLFNLDTSNFNTAGLNDFIANITEPIYAELTSEDGLLTTQLQVTAEGILSTVAQTYADQSYVASQIQQSANSILTTVQGYDYQTGSEVTSAINTSLGGLSLSVTNSSGGYSEITLKSGNATISSGQITLGGNVVFTGDLTDGSTVISGDNIQTGSISADYIDTSTLNAASITMKGYQSVYMGNGTTWAGYIGGATGQTANGSTNGILIGYDFQHYLIATSSGVRMQAGNSYLVVGSGYIDYSLDGSTIKSLT